MVLTVKKIARLKSEPGRYLDGEVKGLYLQVISPSNVSGLLRYEIRGKKRWKGEGSLSDFSWEEIRARARKDRQLLADGIDPLEVKRADRAKAAAAAASVRTFAEVTVEYVTAHADGWSEKHRADFPNSLREHASSLASLSVATIDEALVLSVLRPIWSEKTVTATRVRSRIEAILDFAKSAGYRPAGDNPARWKGHLEYLLARPEKIHKVEHLKDLKYPELPKFMNELRSIPGVPAKALEFMILTAARTNEVVGARWEEIKADVWTIPGERMKGRKQHRVPLSTAAIKLLKALPREGDYVFPGAKAGKPIGKKAMLITLRNLREGVDVHGFRTSFRTWGEERNYPRAVMERCLAHVVGTKVERVYQRSDLLEARSKVMQDWATFVESPIGVSEVTPLRRVRS